MKIKNATKKGYLEAEVGDGIDISGRMQYHRGTVQKGMSQSLTTSGGGNVGVMVDKRKPILVGGKGEKCNKGTQYHLQNRVYSSSSSSSAITTAYQPSYEMDSDIRKLTPRECFRLMGLYDNEIDKIIDKFSDAILYHLAGDSIVVQVLENIFKELL